MSFFRIIPPYPDDFAKAYIRIPRAEMERLGVSSGDIVRVKGSRDTAAMCMPLDKTLPHDPTFEFLHNTERIQHLTRPSDLVFQNAGGEVLSLVEIEKAEDVVTAESITLASRRPYTYKAESLDLKSLIGTPFTKGDWIRIAIKESDSIFPFAEFGVVDAKPNSEILVISENTKFNFVSYNYRNSLAPQLSKLKKRFQIGKQISDKRLGISLESFENYEDEWRLYLETRVVLDEPTEWLENIMHVVISAHDDIGTVYKQVKTRKVESRWTEEGSQCNKLLLTFVPAIKKDVSKITIEIDEIAWKRRDKKDLQFLEQINEAIRGEPTVVSVWQQQKSHYMVAQGPWRLDIKI